MRDKPLFRCARASVRCCCDAQSATTAHMSGYTHSPDPSPQLRQQYLKSLEEPQEFFLEEMVGLGEFKEEVLETMDDLRKVGVSILTIGQYMQPTKKHLSISEFVHPDTFTFYKEEGMKRGFTHVESGPLVRSSYHAEKHL